VVECQLPKLDVVGSSPIARSNFYLKPATKPQRQTYFTAKTPRRQERQKQRLDLSDFPTFFLPVFLRRFSIKPNIEIGTLPTSLIALGKAGMAPLHLGGKDVLKGLLVLLWFFPRPSLAQVTADPSRPFGQGQVFLLPAMTDYVGDIPHEIDMTKPDFPFNTVFESLATNVGWLNAAGGTQPGLRAATPGLLFEGIPYPFASTAILGWMPAVQTEEILDFPASAWWGPKAAAGAVQLEAPVLSDRPQDQLSLWGGNENFGGRDFYQGPLLTLDGNYQHQLYPGAGFTDNFNLLSRAQWIKNDGMEAGDGFLGAQQASGDYWYSAFANLKIFSPDFQSFQLKPYFQKASLGGESVEEFGSYGNYLLNLAGLAQSHFGMGFSHDDSQLTAGPSGLNQGFVQTTNFIDALGDATLDASFRFDFSSAANTAFSTLIGGQWKQDAFVFLGNYAKGVLEDPETDVQQADLGVQYQPDEELSSALKAVREQLGNGSFDGGRFDLRLNEAGPLLFIFKRVQLRAGEEILGNANGTTFDTGGQIQFSLLDGTLFWARGRALSSQGLYGEAGGSCSFNGHFEVFAAAANRGPSPAFGLEPELTEGFTLRAGVQGTF
jgi:hypothetical protein